MQPHELTSLDQALLNDFQRDFPLEPQPFARMAQSLGVGEDVVIERLRLLQETGLISRVGPVFPPNRLGVSTLAAMAVKAERLEEVAALVSAFPEVNHNYEREHHFNLWFVATAPNPAHLDRVLHQIAELTGLEVLDLPMIDDFHIDLGFRLQWT
ncbi:MAG: Lrp/AsnC family transcriptional regulator [Gammaproteobacteria bacterium]|nr:Lrp/AsnC family transcriptional regulator [Gammaproteobacteria bacterium]MBU1655897.1 Lrp/AsnC family transcriptional regulator [Gammaproteobacteria bacterium]MBU1961006.1 Lrp/AsnC family transcriptional regulator [Gammaproteobacteria bacterium]